MTNYEVLYGKTGKWKRFTSKIQASKFAMKKKPCMEGGLGPAFRKLGYKKGKVPATVHVGSKTLTAQQVKKTAKKKQRKSRSSDPFGLGLW